MCKPSSAPGARDRPARTGCENCRRQAERQSRICTGRRHPQSGKARLNDGVLRIVPAPAVRRSHFGNYANDISPNVIFLTRDRGQDHLRWRTN